MRGKPRRLGCAGQQMGEFAILVSAVALAAVSVSFLAQRAIARGVQTASDVVLDQLQTKPLGEDAFQADSTSGVEEAGDGQGLRRTKSSNVVTGWSEGRNVTLRPIIPRRTKP